MTCGKFFLKVESGKWKDFRKWKVENVKWKVESCDYS